VFNKQQLSIGWRQANFAQEKNRYDQPGRVRVAERADNYFEEGDVDAR
jgi:hypothetical protein